jgi:hypothetical protein
VISKALRWTAIAIAVMALLDPSLIVSGRARPRVSVLAEDAASAATAAVRRDLEARLRPDFEVVDGVDADAAHTIVIGTRYPDAFIPGKASTISIAAPIASGARIVAVQAPTAVPPATAVHLVVQLDGRAAKGTTADVSVTSSGVEVGRATHAWTDGAERWNAEMDVVPVSGPPFVFHIEAGPAERADAVVAERRDPLRVLVYEPRPSWASTFVRRALETDARFDVSADTAVSRGVAVRTGRGGRLSEAALDDFDVVIVGGLDRLTEGDANRLARFLRERGGSVALVPDMPLNGAPVRTLAGDDLQTSETLLEHPAALTARRPLPEIEASELLTFSSMNATAIVRSSSGAAVVVSMPKGDGELLVSGALDAWRYRAEPRVAFDEFWRATIAGLALSAREEVDVKVTPPMLRPGENGHVTARVRDQSRDASVSARIVNGGAIRLRPTAAPGEFAGTFTAPAAAGPYAVRVSSNGASARSSAPPFVVGDKFRPAPAGEPPLALLSASHGGIDVDEHHLDVLAASLRAGAGGPTIPLGRHPMRSAWWFLPFTACLSGEWWLRRRNGLP